MCYRLPNHLFIQVNNQGKYQKYKNTAAQYEDCDGNPMIRLTDLIGKVYENTNLLVGLIYI